MELYYKESTLSLSWRKVSLNYGYEDSLNFHGSKSVWPLQPLGACLKTTHRSQRLCIWCSAGFRARAWAQETKTQEEPWWHSISVKKYAPSSPGEMIAVRRGAKNSCNSRVGLVAGRAKNRAKRKEFFILQMRVWHEKRQLWTKRGPIPFPPPCVHVLLLISAILLHGRTFFFSFLLLQHYNNALLRNVTNNARR